MPFIPHTEDEVRQMLSTCGVESLEALFDEIPDNLRVHELEGVPEAVGEQEISRIMHRRAEADGMPMSFLGAGAYEHHIPAAVWEITTRGEYYSAYTPYQAEASQGTLQLIYEYQTMMASLTGMEVSNASLYDGASALAEACLMAVRANRKSKARRILMPATVHPLYRQVAEAICGSQDIVFDTLPYDKATGRTLLAELERYEDADVTAVVIPQPNFFGVLEQADEMADWAHARKALTIGVVNPTTLGVLQPPGEWGETGADIVCGEGQPLGVPLSSGGPYFGLMCCKQKYVRQMPGRLSGKTVDLDGREGYTLTLQPREQHIRRSKATSNICTNQGLMVTAATIYMSLLGPDGLERVAATSHQRTRDLVDRLTSLDGVTRVFSEPFFHEAVVALDRPAGPVLDALAERGILGGLELSRWYPELENCLLVCATETKLDEDLDAYVDALNTVMRDTRVA